MVTQDRWTRHAYQHPGHAGDIGCFSVNWAYMYMFRGRRESKHVAGCIHSCPVSFESGSAESVALDPCLSGKWPAWICLAFSHSTWLPRLFLSAVHHASFWLFCTRSLPVSKKCSANAAALHRHLLCLIHDALKKHNRSASLEVFNTICSGLPNWLRLLWQIWGSYHVKLFWALCLSVIQCFWHGLLTFMCTVKKCNPLPPPAWGKP